MSTRVAAVVLFAALAASFNSLPAMAGSQGKPDPFRRQVPKKAAPAAPVLRQTEIAPPGLTARLAACESTSTAFGSSVKTTPCPYLVGELRLTGVYSGDEIGAVALAEPTKETVFLRVGDKLYDGEVVAISEATLDAKARVTFKKVTQFRAKGGARSEARTVTLELAN